MQTEKWYGFSRQTKKFNESQFVFSAQILKILHIIHEVRRFLKYIKLLDFEF